MSVENLQFFRSRERKIRKVDVPLHLARMNFDLAASKSLASTKAATKTDWPSSTPCESPEFTTLRSGPGGKITPLPLLHCLLFALATHAHTKKPYGCERSTPTRTILGRRMHSREKPNAIHTEERTETWNPVHVLSCVCKIAVVLFRGAVEQARFAPWEENENITDQQLRRSQTSS